mgnify:CR=1 FL=1
MDAVKFLKEYDRMCGLYNEERCAGCPLQNDICAFYPFDELDNIVQVVEKWSAEHPIKTRLMDFLEKFPNAPLCGADKVPYLLPVNLGYCKVEYCRECEHYPCSNVDCWHLPLEE